MLQNDVDVAMTDSCCTSCKHLIIDVLKHRTTDSGICFRFWVFSFSIKLQLPHEGNARNYSSNLHVYAATAMARATSLKKKKASQHFCGTILNEPEKMLVLATNDETYNSHIQMTVVKKPVVVKHCTTLIETAISTLDLLRNEIHSAKGKSFNILYKRSNRCYAMFE